MAVARRWQLTTVSAGYRNGVSDAEARLMPKSATPMRNQRVFLFNWAILLNNM